MDVSGDPSIVTSVIPAFVVIKEIDGVSVWTVTTPSYSLDGNMVGVSVLNKEECVTGAPVLLVSEDAVSV